MYSNNVVKANNLFRFRLLKLMYLVFFLNNVSALKYTYVCLWHLSIEQILGGELIPFMCSGSHVIQKDCHPSSIHTFLEGLSHCVPPVPIRPCVLKVSL